MTIVHLVGFLLTVVNKLTNRTVVSHISKCCKKSPYFSFHIQSFLQFNPFVTSGTCVPLTKSLFKSAGITVSHFFSMLPPTLKHLYSVEPVRMHFPTKQQCTNNTVCNATMLHCTQFNGIEILHGRWQHGEKVGYCYPSRIEKTLCKWDTYALLVTIGLTHPLYVTDHFNYCI
jgi:hypothetical protein